MEIKEVFSLADFEISDLLELMGELTSSTPVSAEMLMEVVRDPSAHLFAAFEGEHIVGCATLCIFTSPTGRKGRIEDVVVSSSCRGQGLGRRLMEFAIDFARREYSPVQLSLTSRPSRQAANRLYQSLGFQFYDTNVYKLYL